MIFDQSQILKIIKDNPLNTIKLIFLSKGEVTQSRIFVSNWDLFDFLEKLKASNDFDTLLIAAKTAPKIVETRNFMDGKLLKYLGIITYDDDKIPENITLFYKSAAKLQKISAPFFLFKEPKKNDICDNPTAAIASSFWRVSNARVALNRLTLAYALPKQWFKSIGIKSARVNVTGQNLINFYNPYPDSFTNPMAGGYGSYPNLRKWTIGVNLSF